MSYVKKCFLILVCVFTVTSLFINMAFAQDYSKTASATVSSGGASALVKCTGTYHSSGNTRWSRSWFATITSGKNAYTGDSTMTVPSDAHMTTTGKIYITNNQLVTNTASKTFKFKYSNGAVTLE